MYEKGYEFNDELMVTDNSQKCTTFCTNISQ